MLATLDKDFGLVFGEPLDLWVHGPCAEDVPNSSFGGTALLGALLELRKARRCKWLTHKNSLRNGSTFNPLVTGSIPVRPTNEFKPLPPTLDAAGL